MTSVLIIVKIGENKKKVIWRQPKAGVKQQQAEEHMELGEFERGKDRFTPWTLKEHSPVNILIWYFWPPELWDNNFSC